MCNAKITLYDLLKITAKIYSKYFSTQHGKRLKKKPKLISDLNVIVIVYIIPSRNDANVNDYF